MVKQSEFQRTMLRFDPINGKVFAYIANPVNAQKTIVEKEVTTNFITMMLSYMLQGSKNGEKPILIRDELGNPAYELTFKKL